MKTNLTRHDVTPNFRRTARELLAVTAAASVTREAVDDVKRQVLAGGGLRDPSGKRISNPERDWVCEDDDALRLYWATLNERMLEAGVKPPGMQADFCPALVAEQAQIEVEWALLDEAARMLGVYEEAGGFNNGLLCIGIGKRRRFLDICIGLVLALEGEGVR